MDWTFAFPEALRRLDHNDPLAEAKRSEFRVDAHATLERYCRVMNLGLDFDRFVQSSANTEFPNRITTGNLENSRRIHSLGWSYRGLADLVDLDLPELAGIPPDADLFETRDHDAAAIGALVRISRFRGVRVANATKFLYQKRPRLFPILDDQDRLALGAVRTHGDGDPAYREAYRIGFAQMRRTVRHGRNAEVLGALGDWLGSHPSLSAGLSLSRVRLVHVMAWGTVSAEHGNGAPLSRSSSG